MGREQLEAVLSEGRPNSLGRTQEVVDFVLADGRRLPGLLAAYDEITDEQVRLRLSNAVKKVLRERPEWIASHFDALVAGVGTVDQPSARWTFAQVLTAAGDRLSGAQRRRAQPILRADLEGSDDWIVQNSTMQTLWGWSASDAELRDWLVPRLARLAESPRKSVANRARRMLASLDP